MDPILGVLGAVIVALISGFFVYLGVKRGTSGGPKETAAEKLWDASEKMRDDLTAAVKAAEERDIARQQELATLRKEVGDMRTEMIDEKRVSRTQIELLEAKIRELEAKLQEAWAEVTALKARLGEQ